MFVSGTNSLRIKDKYMGQILQTTSFAKGSTGGDIGLVEQGQGAIPGLQLRGSPANCQNEIPR